MKVGDFKGEVGQRGFFFKRIVFSGFDAVAVKVCSPVNDETLFL